ncbi:MAG: PDZ domain-containing protein [Candidatus Obscuribacterales bacterium]|nr:PDZ domain-containing protein [Candidatus Obscuribacterales bacterium]
MKTDNENPSSKESQSGLAALRLAFASTCALGLSWLLAWGLALVSLKAAYALPIPWLVSYLPALSVASLSFGVAFFVVLTGYLHFSRRLTLLTRWSERLPAFLHLRGEWPEYPTNLGWNYVGHVGTRYFFGAVTLATAAALGLDYLSSMHHGHFGDSASEALAAMRGDQSNFFAAALFGVLLSAFVLELVFRGFVQNLWYSAFKTIGRSLALRPGFLSKFAGIFSYGAGVAAIAIAAALFALVYDTHFLTGFYIGIAAGAAYLFTRSIWAAIFVHVLVKTIWLVVFIAANSAVAEHLAEDDSSASGLRVPGAATVFAQPGTQAKPIKKVVESDFLKPDFATGGNVLIQICRSEDCTEEWQLLETLAKQFPDVEFMQADTAANPSLVERLSKQQRSIAADSSLALPVYLYVNGNIQVAPPGTAQLADVTKFVQINRSSGGPQLAGGQEDAGPDYVSKACNPDNQGPFDGRTLYNCVFDLVLKTDLALLDKSKRDAFALAWQTPTSSLTNQAETAKAIRSMLASLNEMHTHFFTVEEFASLSESFDASLTGIGAPVIRLNVAGKLALMGENPSEEVLKTLAKIDEATPLVIYPAPTDGGPAEKAGLKRADRIIEVNGQSVNGMTVDQVIAAIRGKEGTAVALKVRRENSPDLEFSIVRAKVQTKEVHLDELGNGRFKVKVDMFGNRVSQEFTEALYQACTGKSLPLEDAELAALVNQYVPEKDCSGVKSMVIDLRGNPGGRLDQVVEMMQAIVRDGKIVTTLSRAGDDIVEVMESVNEKDFVRESFKGGKSVRQDKQPRMMRILPSGLPLAVLVDAGSASASELMSGALQRGKFALIIGKPTFGKEVGQAVNPLDFGTGLKITTFRFLPGGADLGVAVIPDIEVANSSAFLDNPIIHNDEVLDKALEVLQAGLGKFKPMDVEHRKALESKTRAEHEARDRRILEMQKKALAN